MEKTTLNFSQEAIDFIHSLFEQGEDKELIYIAQEISAQAFWEVNKGASTIISKDFFEKHFNFVKSLKENSDNKENYDLLQMLFYSKDPDVCKVANDTYLEIFLEKMDKKYPFAPNKEIAELMNFILDSQIPEAKQISEKCMKVFVETGSPEKAFHILLTEGVQLVEQLHQLKNQFPK